MATIEDIDKQCLTSIFVNVDNGLSFDGGQLSLYIFTLLGLLGSVVIILTSNKYIKTDSGFGNLILAMSISDFLVSMSWLTANLTSDLTNYKHCVEDTDLAPVERYMIDNLFSFNDSLLLLSSFLGLAVAYIAIAVLYLNALTSNIKWRKLVVISSVISIVYFLIILAIHTARLLSSGDMFIFADLQPIQDIIIALTAGLVVVLSVFLFAQTYRAMRSLQSDSTTIMLSLIQAITVSNIICWIPLILFRSTSAALFLSNYYESNLVYFLIYCFFTGTAPAKGLYHLLSLWISEWWIKYKIKLNQKAALDTIDWLPTKDYPVPFSNDTVTL